MIKNEKKKLNSHERLFTKSSLPKGSAIIENQNFTKKLIQEIFVDFCNETNLHGFRQIVDEVENVGSIRSRKYLKFWKNLLWSLSIVLGLVFGIYLLFIVLIRYETTPTITTVETNNYGVWNVQFPAVTICNINGVYKPHTVNVTKRLLAANISQYTINNFYSNLSGLVTYEIVRKEFFQISDILVGWGYTMDSLMRELAIPCNKMLRVCRWLGKLIKCDDIFKVARSDLGYCCSFNYVQRKSTLDSLNANHDELNNSRIVHLAGAGEEIGLRVGINVEASEYMSPKKSYYGADIIIHDAEDFPEKTAVVGVAQPGYELAIAVNAALVVTEQGVRSYPVELRLCRFEDEKKLEISRTYSYQSCITECRAATVLEKCNCLPYFYPVVSYNQNNISSYRECSLHDIACLNKNKHIFASMKPPKNFFSILNISSDGMKCDCYPSCTEQFYTYEVFTTRRSDGLRPTNLLAPENYGKISVLKIYYKDLSCIKYRREIFMTWDALLASFGGIFGLCLGGSVLSLVELFYYFTIKLFTKYLWNKHQIEEDGKVRQIITNQNFINFGKKEFPRPPAYFDVKAVN